MGRIAIACRSCGSVGLESILNLGKLPLANALPRPEELGTPDPAYPLEVAFCPACALVQITETLPPDALFRDSLYFSSFSDTLVNHAAALVGRTIARRNLDSDSLAVEIASNDGYLLQHYVRSGVPVLGIEPARNIAEVAVRERGVQTVCEFFGEKLAIELAAGGRQADVIHANNVLAHVPDPNGFVRGIAALLKPDGVAFIEVPYLRELMERCEFDTIYHEHLCYFSLTALDELFLRNGLVIRDVERLEIHGGSLRLHVGHPSAGRESARVCNLLAEEQAWGAGRISRYREFAGQVEALRDSLLHELENLEARGHRIAAYGAAAKASILLNYCGIGPETVEFVADRSTYKQGRFIPGARIPIVPPERLAAERPDACLLLAWNFAEEIVRQQAAYVEAGGQFIVPIPMVRVLRSESLRSAA
jgi:SAM-dependent methyltransferase